ncbi:MAG: S8 family serine peptidase [Patescibacteria group bacterium]
MSNQTPLFCFKKISLLLIFILAIIPFSAVFSAQEASLEMVEKVPDEIIIRFKGEEGISVIRIADSDDFQEILDFYNDNEAVEYAEPNFTYESAATPSDSYFDDQWYLHRIKAVDAWDAANESPGIVIAILDSGVQTQHPDLKDNIWINEREISDNKIDDDKNGFIDDINGWDFVNNSADPSPKFKEGFTEAGIQHGTVVAGIAAASGNNAAGIAGITWKAKIMPLKILDDKGEGSTSNVIKGIDYAIANGADIINFSFVGFGYSKSLDEAVKRAYDAGVIMVAAAGNDQDGGDGYSLDSTPMYPVCYDGNGENRVIGVAATDTLDQKASFSSHGFKCVDIAAPGLGIFSTVVYSPTNRIGDKPFNKYYDGYWAGTSMATPIVSAALALTEAINPSLSRNQAVDIILNTADNINKLNPNYLNQLGKGRINLLSAVKSASESLNDKYTKLVLSPLSGYKSYVKITDENGKINGEEFLSYGESFKGGANIGSGDIDGDGIEEIITGAGQGGGPHIRIFDASGKVKGQFFAYASNFRGGVNVACGDIDGDGANEIITGPGQGGGPHIRIFKPTGEVEGQFFAFDSSFRGGVRIAVANVVDEVKSKSEIIAVPGQGYKPQVKIFDNKSTLLSQFSAYNENFSGGMKVAAGDINNDGLAEIITGAGQGGTPHVRVFNKKGSILGSFYAFESEFSGGVNVSSINIKAIK